MPEPEPKPDPDIYETATAGEPEQAVMPHGLSRRQRANEVLPPEDATDEATTEPAPRASTTTK